MDRETIYEELTNESMKVILLENWEIENGTSEKIEMSEWVKAVLNMTGKKFEYLLNCPIEQRKEAIRKTLSNMVNIEGVYLEGLA